MDRIALYLGDAIRIPFAEDTFEVVFALETAFHFRTREDLLDEARRVLQPGGTPRTTDVVDGPERKNASSIDNRPRCGGSNDRW